MSISEEIDRLRAALPGCSLVAFGDVKTRLILRASHDTALRREHLDDLCEQAVDCFALAEATSQATGCARTEPGLTVDAVVLCPSDLRAFVKPNGASTDFLCVVCDTGADPDAVTSATRSTLGQIEEWQ